MTILEAVRKAIDGGWQKYVEGDKFSVVDAEAANNLHAEMTADGYEGELAEALIDPEFWKGLGKSMGWTNDATENIMIWKYEWHNLIDHLAEDKDTEDFFAELK